MYIQEFLSENQNLTSSVLYRPKSNHSSISCWLDKIAYKSVELLIKISFVFSLPAFEHVFFAWVH
jgi:hypothetical protein